ncbi:MAG: sulfatase [Deltaproteobacteria bacterium]|nr:sulfatase [Deltaproteobacteria bacterium]
MTSRWTRRRVLATGARLGAVALGSSVAGACRSRRVDRPNVLLVTLDTTRADHLGCYGYGRDTSPTLDALAAESVLYTRALAPGTWTLPSHASLFTGKCPTSHGARYDPHGSLVLASAIPNRPTLNEYRVRGLAPTETTLASVLGKAGYHTGGVAGGPWLKGVFGLGTGFAWWDDDGIGSVNGRVAADLNARALPWLDRVEEPFFLFLNYFDAHAPFLPPVDLAARYLSAPVPPGAPPTPEQTLALYDAEIRYADQHLGDVVRLLARRNLYDRTWIIVTSDHGELFGEHGLRGHGTAPYQEVLHVPFVSKPPLGDGGLGERADPIQLTDVMALVLERLGVPRPDGTQGAVPPKLGRPLMAESYVLAALYPYGDWFAIFDGDWKYMWNSQGASALYDLAADPREETNLLAADPERAASMERAMRQYLADLPRAQGDGPGGNVDDATREALKSLGYID